MRTAISIVSRTDQPEMPGFPPDVAEKIMLFLRLRHTGTIELRVTQGHIVGYKIAEFGRIGRPLDDSGSVGHDSS